MNIETRMLKHVSVVKVTGRVDSATAPDFEKALQALLDADNSQIAVDLKETDYLSSAGVRVLVSALKAAKKAGGDVKLAQLSQRVAEVLDLAGLTPVFEVYTDLVEAVGSF
jgi:anti-sigma B factor antagonist